MMRRVFVLALSAFVLTATVACENFNLSGLLGGSNGSTSSDAVEQFLPDDISLEVDELPDSDTATGKSNSAMTVTGVTAYDRTLRATGAIVHAFQRTARRTFAIGAVLHRDMTSRDQTQVAGTVRVDGAEVNYLADFAAFDIDGDGTADGSGNAVDLPIAVRIWTDKGNGFARFFCALITKKPSDEHRGAGRLFVHPDAAREAANDDLQIKVMWDRSDANHKWHEAYVSGKVRTNYTMSDGHQRVDWRNYEDGHVEKTVRSSNNFTETPFGFDSYKFSSHYKRGSGAVLISGMSTGGTTEVDFENICVNLTDREVADNGACDDFDTQDVDFIDTPTGGESDFPAGFPEDPTFSADDLTEETDSETNAQDANETNNDGTQTNPS